MKHKIIILLAAAVLFMFSYKTLTAAEDGHKHNEAEVEKHEHSKGEELKKTQPPDHRQETGEKHEESGHNHKPGEKCGTEEKTKETGETGHTEEKEIKIEGLAEVPAISQTIYDTIKANGVIKFHPDHYAKVLSLAPGRVKEIKVKIGDRVKKGQELAILESVEIFNAKSEYLKNLNKYEISLAKYENTIKTDSNGNFINRNQEDAKNELAAARSSFEKTQINISNAQKKVDRLKKLVESGITPKAELENAEAELKSANAEYQLEKSKFETVEKAAMRAEKSTDSKLSIKKEIADIQAEFMEANANLIASAGYLKAVGVECDPQKGCITHHNLSEFSLYAPIDGVIIEQNLAIGSPVDTANPVMTMGDYDKVIGAIDIYENDFNKISAGQTVEVYSKSGQKYIYGSINYIANQLETNSRTIKAQAEFTDDAESLKVGEFINCLVYVNEKPNAVTVPAEAVIDDSGNKVVFVKCGKSYDKNNVETGAAYGDRIEIKKGVSAGDIVVTTGNYQLLNMSLANTLELSCEGCKK
ncbi:MAG: efflux RND transporter periplasmic adaptor subunit [Candidatus Wallbacteria bacterium]